MYGGRGAMRDIDLATLQACQRGETAAFRTLVAAYQRSVFSLCVALAGSDGPDLAQETFLRVHRTVAQFDPRGTARLSTWILTIARRLCTDHARKLQVRRETAAAWPAASPAFPSPEVQADAHAAERRLRRQFATLPQEQRAVLALRVWDGLDYEEIAAIEGIPVGTVRSRLARAREALAAVLEPQPNDVEGGRRVVRKL